MDNSTDSEQPPPPPPRHSSKLTPPPLPPKSNCWITTTTTTTSPSLPLQAETSKKNDLKAIQKKALLEFYLKHKKKQQEQQKQHSSTSLHQQNQPNQCKPEYTKSFSCSNIFHPKASSSKVELVVSNPSNGFTNTSESFNCLPSASSRNHTGLTANNNHCSTSTATSSSLTILSSLVSVNPPKLHTGNGFVCGNNATNSETLVAPKTVNGLKYSPPPLPATSMHLQQQQITNIALPALHSKTPSNASSNTLDSESCFTGPGSSGTLTSNCSSSSGIGSSNTSSSSESTTSSNSSDSSSNGHSGHPADPLLLNAITNDHLTDTQMESLSSFPNYPPPPPPPLAPLTLNPCPLPAPPLPPPPSSTTSSSVGSHSMKVRVSGSFTGPQPDDTFTMSRVTNFCSPTTDSLSTCSYQRPVSIGAIESISTGTPSMVRVHSSNQHNYHNGQSHHAHHHHHHHQPNHQHHEPIRLSNNCASENGVSCNQPLFNGRDATLKSSGAHLSNSSNCYNTMIASGLTSSSSPLSTTTITTTTHKHNALSDNTVSLSDSRQYQANGMVNWRSSSPTNQVKNEMNKVNGNSLCDLRSTDANKLSESWSLRQPGSTSMGQYQATPIDPNCTSTSTMSTTSSSFSFPFPSAPFNKCVKRSIASDEVQRVNDDDDINSKNVINENCVLNSTIKLIRQSNECKESDESNVIGRGEAIGSSSTASSDGYSSGSLSPTSSPSSLELALDRPYIVHSMCGQAILSNSSEAIPKLTEHLDCLRAEYSQMQSEIQTNESIGASLVERLTQAGLTWQETEKISIHLEEIEKITRLLLSLSTRLKSIEADINSKNVSSPLGGNPSGSTHNNNNNVGCEKLVSSSLFSSSSSTSCSSALYFNKQSLTSSSSSGSASASVFSDNRIDNRCNKNVNPELESLLLKRNKLLAQLEEAIALKESIDRTSQTISDKIIVKYFKQSSQDVDSFVRFIQLKSKLIVEEKELIDKIEIKERQLLNLTNAT
uniref:ASD2 domain-containing protein n=1 Tax=Tetranychus urticae TaxID=32264 RepID=T1KTT1_TETUR